MLISMGDSSSGSYGSGGDGSSGDGHHYGDVLLAARTIVIKS
jgi:hypothetical protein